MANYVYTAGYPTIYASIPLTASPTAGSGGNPTVWNWATAPADGRWAATSNPVNQAADNGGPGNPGPTNPIVTSAGDSLISGHGNPPAYAGHDGDYWMDVDTTTLWGPKLGGAWPGAGVSLIGGGGAVTSVNGATGAVTITAAGLNALAINAAAAGDLAGTLPSPTVARVNGVAVSGTPASGYVPTATGAAAATWQALPAATTTVSGIVRLDGTSTDITGLGATTAGSVGQAADAGHVHAAYEWMPADQGLAAWSYDPSAAGTTWVPTSTTNGNLFLTAVILRSPATITNVVYGLSGAQTSGLTTGENLIGLYSASGTLLTQTVDQTAVWSSSGNVKVNVIPWTTPQSLAPGRYFVAWLYNGVTTGAALNFKASGAGTTANAGQTGASLRYGMITGTATALPATITLASMVTPVPFNNQWVGLS